MDRAGSGGDWDSRWKTGDTPWEKGAAHPALKAWLGQYPFSGRVLVPGCGSGNDVRIFATSGAMVTGLDISTHGIAAADLHPKTGNESYRVADLFDLPSEYRGSFDMVFEHTCFCAIDPTMRTRYVEAVASALKPGGKLLAIFYMNPDHGDSGPPFGTSTDELDALFLSKFRLVVEEFPIPTFPGRDGRERLRLYAKS